jgi:hypothetical protein
MKVVNVNVPWDLDCIDCLGAMMRPCMRVPLLFPDLFCNLALASATVLGWALDGGFLCVVCLCWMCGLQDSKVDVQRERDARGLVEQELQMLRRSLAVQEVEALKRKVSF